MIPATVHPRLADAMAQAGHARRKKMPLATRAARYARWSRERGMEYERAVAQAYLYAYKAGREDERADIRALKTAGGAA